MDKTKKRKKSNAMLEVFKRLRRMPVAMFGLIGLCIIVVLAILAPVIAPYSPTEMDLTSMYAAPSAKHLFGCDAMGRDVFSRILYGGRYSLSLGLSASLLQMVFGVVVGCAIGYAGGAVDNIAMRICDIISAIPGQLLAVLVSASLGAGFGTTIFAMTVGGLTGGVRGSRAMALKERNMEYLEAARAMNCSTPKIIYKHMMPNILSPTIVATTMGVGGTIQGAAGLAYIGLGVRPPLPEWGAMLSDAQADLLTHPELMIYPGVAIALTILLINMFGDGLRDAMDPKLKD